MQTISNDAIVGMWWDQQIVNNPTVTTTWENVLKTYYMYDGFVLLQNGKVVDATNAADAYWSCIQIDAFDATKMSCAIVTGTSATDMKTTAKQTTALMTTPTHCAKERQTTTAPVALSTPLPSAWSERPCNGDKDFRDGTLGCWGQYFRSEGSANYWSTW